MTQAMANSPALLNRYLALSAALSRGRLRPAAREQIALAIAERDGCDYCMSVHTSSRRRSFNLGHHRRRPARGQRRSENRRRAAAGNRDQQRSW